MIVLSLLSEIIASMLAIISPVISNKTATVFILAGVLKCIFLIVFDMDKDYKTVLTTSITSFMFYIGIILKLVLNIPTSQMYKETLLGVAGIIVGSIIAKLIYSYDHLVVMNSKKVAIITGITTSMLLILCTIAYTLFMVTGKDNKPLGDGSIAIGSFTLQLPEIIKILLVLVTFISSLLMYEDKGYIWFVYIPSGISCLLVSFYFKEYGTSLLVIYFSLASGISLSTNRKYKNKCKNKVAEFLNSEIFPCIVGTLFFFVIKFLKDILYRKYPLRGSIGEEIYTGGWFKISQRLWADAPQTAEARNILKNASLIPLNLNFEVQIPNCKPETAISDYCIVVLSLGFGKFITILLLTTFVVLLAFTFIKSDYLGKAASLMMISQVTVQISGIMGFCFTGVNIPFISAGASSMFSSFVLFTFIIYSMRRNTNA